MVLNHRCLPEPLGMALRSTQGLSSTYRSGTPFACCSGTPSSPFNYTSVRVLCGGALVLGGGATGAPSSSNHSDIAALYVRVVWSLSSEMLPGLWGATPAIFLFLWASSSVATLFPRTFSDTWRDSPFDQHLRLWTLMRL